ncbi:glycoside hydrolase superfamily [Aspergillus aurantiobrunneus]
MAKELLTIISAVLGLASLASAFDPEAKSNVAIYYGQGSNQPRLAEFCQETAFDIINIGFINSFLDQDPLTGLPGSNFGNQCWADTYVVDGIPSKLYSQCPNLVEDIPLCQAAGKKVFLSLGGGHDTYWIDTIEASTKFADWLWGAFGPKTDVWESTDSPRPFGDAVVDGFDFDIEYNGSWGYANMIKRLRKRFEETSDRAFYISAAPQCPIPDQQLGVAIANSFIDFVWVQFYNSNPCSARDFVEGTKNGFNFDDWVKVIKEGANPNAKLYVGLPASESAAQPGFYLTPEEVQPLVKKYMDKYPETFGGVMLWEATESRNNQIGGVTYGDRIREILFDLDPNHPAPSPTPTSMSTTSTTSTASTTSPSTNSSSATSSTPVPTLSTSTTTSTTSGTPSGSSASTTPSKTVVSPSVTITFTPTHTSTLSESSTTRSETFFVPTSSTPMMSKTPPATESSTPATTLSGFPASPSTSVSVTSSSVTSGRPTTSKPSTSSTSVPSNTPITTGTSTAVPSSTSIASPTSTTCSESSIVITTHISSSTPNVSKTLSASTPTVSLSTSTQTTVTLTVFPTPTHSGTTFPGVSTSSSSMPPSNTHHTEASTSKPVIPTSSASSTNTSSTSRIVTPTTTVPSTPTSSLSATTSSAQATNNECDEATTTTSMTEPTTSHSSNTASVTVEPTATEPVTTTTIIVTWYTSICPTGFTTITTTLTSTYCPGTASASATATNPPGSVQPTDPADIPEGWTSTVTVCSVCAATPTTVTLTLPPAETFEKSTSAQPTDSPVEEVPSGEGYTTIIGSKSTTTAVIIAVPSASTSNPVIGGASSAYPSSTFFIHPSTSRVSVVPSGTQGDAPIFTGGASRISGLAKGVSILIALSLSCLW